MKLQVAPGHSVRAARPRPTAVLEANTSSPRHTLTGEVDLHQVFHTQDVGVEEAVFSNVRKTRQI